MSYGMVEQSLWCASWRAMVLVVDIDSATTCTVTGGLPWQYPTALVKRSRQTIVHRPWALRVEIGAGR